MGQSDPRLLLVKTPVGTKKGTCAAKGIGLDGVFLTINVEPRLRTYFPGRCTSLPWLVSHVP